MGKPELPRIKTGSLCKAVSLNFISYVSFRSGIHPIFTHTVHGMLGLKTFYDKLSEFPFFFQQTIIVNSRAKHSLIHMFLTSTRPFLLRCMPTKVSTIIFACVFNLPYYHNK